MCLETAVTIFDEQQFQDPTHGSLAGGFGFKAVIFSTYLEESRLANRVVGSVENTSLLPPSRSGTVKNRT